MSFKPVRKVGAGDYLFAGESERDGLWRIVRAEPRCWRLYRWGPRPIVLEDIARTVTQGAWSPWVPVATGFATRKAALEFAREAVYP